MLCVPSLMASPPLRFAARGPGPIAGQREPKRRTKRMILKAGRPVVCFHQKALPAMRITALGRLQRGPIIRALIFSVHFPSREKEQINRLTRHNNC